MNSPEEIARIINMAVQAIDRSTFGPLFVYPNPQDFTNKQVNQLAFGVFTIVLKGILENEMHD